MYIGTQSLQIHIHPYVHAWNVSMRYCCCVQINKLFNCVNTPFDCVCSVCVCACFVCRAVHNVLFYCLFALCAAIRWIDVQNTIQFCLTWMWVSIPPTVSWFQAIRACTHSRWAYADVLYFVICLAVTIYSPFNVRRVQNFAHKIECKIFLSYHQSVFDWAFISIQISFQFPWNLINLTQCALVMWCGNKIWLNFEKKKPTTNVNDLFPAKSN